MVDLIGFFRVFGHPQLQFGDGDSARRYLNKVVSARGLRVVHLQRLADVENVRIAGMRSAALPGMIKRQ